MTDSQISMGSLADVLDGLLESQSSFDNRFQNSDVLEPVLDDSPVPNTRKGRGHKRGHSAWDDSAEKSGRKSTSASMIERELFRLDDFSCAPRLEAQTLKPFSEIYEETFDSHSTKYSQQPNRDSSSTSTSSDAASKDPLRRTPSVADSIYMESILREKELEDLRSLITSTDDKTEVKREVRERISRQWSILEEKVQQSMEQDILKYLLEDEEKVLRDIDSVRETVNILEAVKKRSLRSDTNSGFKSVSMVKVDITTRIKMIEGHIKRIRRLPHLITGVTKVDSLYTYADYTDKFCSDSSVKRGKKLLLLCPETTSHFLGFFEEDLAHLTVKKVKRFRMKNFTFELDLIPTIERPHTLPDWQTFGVKASALKALRKKKERSVMALEINCETDQYPTYFQGTLAKAYDILIAQRNFNQKRKEKPIRGIGFISFLEGDIIVQTLPTNLAGWAEGYTLDDSERKLGIFPASSATAFESYGNDSLTILDGFQGQKSPRNRKRSDGTRSRSPVSFKAKST